MNAARMKHPTPDTVSWLIADIGATSSRCATLTNCEQKPRSLGLAVAAPVYGDDIRMINRDWSFSGTSLSNDLNFARVKIINDFHAIAYALPVLDDDARCEVGSATEYRGGNMAAIGPGSGVGAHL